MFVLFTVLLAILFIDSLFVWHSMGIKLWTTTIYPYPQSQVLNQFDTKENKRNSNQTDENPYFIIESKSTIDFVSIWYIFCFFWLPHAYKNRTPILYLARASLFLCYTNTNWPWHSDSHYDKLNEVDLKMNECQSSSQFLIHVHPRTRRILSRLMRI